MIPLIWHTEQRVVRELIPYEKNPRKITEEQKQRLKESLQRFNLTEIPGIDIDDKLIWGFQRVRILIAIGRGDEQIDVRIPNRKLTEEEFRELNIRSNLHAGEWDFDILAVDFSPDILQDWGFSDAEKMLATAAINAESEDNEIPALPTSELLVEIGDSFTINGHRLICGDCLQQSVVGELMMGEKADLIFTDPPYNVAIDSIVNLGKTKHREFIQASGEMSEAEFVDFLSASFLRMKEASKDGSIHFICMDWKHLFQILTAQRKVEYELKQICVWVKDNGGMGTFYRSKHELVLVFKNGKAAHINNFELGQTGRYRTNVWEYPGANSFTTRTKSRDGTTIDVGDLKFHPTVKPLEMVTDAIIDCSHRGHKILDLFLGSGTTLIACEKTGRICMAAELDPAYVEVAIRRFINFLKQQKKPIEFIHHQNRLSLNDFIDE